MPDWGLTCCSHCASPIFEIGEVRSRGLAFLVSVGDNSLGLPLLMRSKVDNFVLGFLALAICGLGYVTLQQQDRIEALRDSTNTAARPPHDEAQSDDVELAARMENLEQRLEQLERTQGQSRRSASAAPPAVNSEEADLKATAPGSRQAREPVAPPLISESAVMDLLESEDPVIQERLGEVVRREQERAFEERWERRRVRSLESLRDRVASFAEQSDLSEAETQWFQAALEGERERIFEIFSRAREDGRFAEARDEAQQIRAQTDEEARQRLDEEQLREFEKLREQERNRFGPFGRGRPAPPRE